MGRRCVDRLRGMADDLVVVDLEAPAIEGTIGLACDVSDPAAVAALAEQVRQLGPFRALAHAAGISPTMGDAGRVFDVDLVGTQRLLDAFDALVVTGSAAVCFSSLAAYQLVSVRHGGARRAFVDEPMAPDFLERAAGSSSTAAWPTAWPLRGVIRAAARAAVAGRLRRPGQLRWPPASSTRRWAARSSTNNR